MSCSLIKRPTQFRNLLLLCAALCGAVLVTPNSLGQKRAEDADKPLFNPTDKGDEQDFFMLNDAESAQIFYDKTKKVMAISANFLRGAQNVPTPKVLFGEELAAKPDGSVYKMTRYPKAGYWLSYSKTAGESPLISVTLQKID
jgi:hypothetical protein